MAHSYSPRVVSFPATKKPLVGAFSAKTLARDVDLPITVFGRDYTVAEVPSLLRTGRHLPRFLTP